MKILLTALCIASTIFMTQGCKSQAKFGEIAENHDANISNPNPHDHHNMDHAPTPKENGNHHGDHNTEHNHLESAIATAQLTIPQKITPNNPVPLVIEIKDKNGQAITNFDKFQEELMHLIVVSDDLQSFHHIHPKYSGNGRFEVKFSFPKSGNYSLFSDYKVAGKVEQVSILKTQVPGNSTSQPAIDFNHTKTIGNTQVSLTSTTSPIKSGKEVNLIFSLQDTVSKQPPTDLKTYLGERGHLVILKQSSPLTTEDYIHAHAQKNTPVHEANFITRFPKPGKYKMWGQFNRNGKIVTADFWVNVQ